MFIHNRGLELPEYPPIFPVWRRVAWTTGAIESASKRKQDHFLRRIRLQVPEATSLKGGLKTADEEIDRFTDITQIEAVAHTWGLTKRPRTQQSRREDFQWRFENPLIPKGYSLVARVENIRPLVEPDKDTFRTALNALLRYSNARHPKLFLRDMTSTHQLGFYAAGEIVDTKLLDIEPLLSMSFQNEHYTNIPKHTHFCD